MSWLGDLPVQRKLGFAMLLTSTIVVASACLVFLTVEYYGYRNSLIRTVATLARITADNSTATLAFADQKSAIQNLEALQAETQIVAAVLYDADGQIFAEFVANPKEKITASATAPTGVRLERGYVIGVHPVVENTQRLGTLYLQASMDQIYERMRTYTMGVLGVLALSFALAWLIASLLRRVLARPILELANTAEAVSTRQDYTLRAHQYGKDELGRLTVAFNDMLGKTHSAIGALQESEWSHRQLVRALPTAAYMCDPRGRLTIYNAAAVTLWGRSPEIGTESWCGSFRMYRADGSPLPLEESPLAMTLREGQAVRGEEIIIERPDGTRRNVMPYPDLIRDTGGKIIGLVNMLLDITEQKLAGATVRQLAAIVESSHDAIIGKDLEGTITTWNRGAERLYGYTAAEIIGQPVTLLIPADRNDEEPSLMERVRRDERIEHYETVRRRKDGSLVDISLTVSSIKDAGGKIIGASKIARDITERKLQVAALEELSRQMKAQAQLFDATLSNISDLAYYFDLKGRWIYANRPLLEIWGRSLEQITGKSCLELGYPPELASRLEAQVQEVIATKSPVRGETLYTSAAGKVDDHEYIFSPVIGADGKVTAVVGTTRLITERKKEENENKRMRDEALAASRAKDDFLAALSHELRTPLNPVLLLASAAAINPELPPAIREDFELVRKNVALEARLIDDLLDLTRITRGKLQLDLHRCDLHSILQDALANVNAEVVEKRLRLVARWGAGDSIVWGDSVRLQQVFWNILKNAVKFTPEEGAISVETTGSDQLLTVKITDTGIGMNPEEIDQAFQAFSQGEHAIPGSHLHRFGGLGLGLAITKMLVELHAGRIHAHSAGRNQGATFVVELPLSRTRERNESRKSVAGRRANSLNPLASSDTRGPFASAGVPRRILLVEDHAPTRLTLLHLLKSRKFDVTPAASATEAFGLALAGEFDLLISDVGLPDRNGYELMAEMRTLKPDMPGIALSGYGMEEDVARSQAAGFSVHLVKPITIGVLEDAIARLLPVRNGAATTDSSRP